MPQGSIPSPLLFLGRGAVVTLIVTDNEGHGFTATGYGGGNSHRPLHGLSLSQSNSVAHSDSCVSPSDPHSCSGGRPLFHRAFLKKGRRRRGAPRGSDALPGLLASEERLQPGTDAGSQPLPLLCPALPCLRAAGEGNLSAAESPARSSDRRFLPALQARRRPDRQKFCAREAPGHPNDFCRPPAGRTKAGWPRSLWARSAGRAGNSGPHSHHTQRNSPGEKPGPWRGEGGGRPFLREPLLRETLAPAPGLPTYSPPSRPGGKGGPPSRLPRCPRARRPGGRGGGAPPALLCLALAWPTCCPRRCVRTYLGLEEFQ